MSIDGNIASNIKAMLIINTKKEKPIMKIVVLADSNNFKIRVLDYGVDDFITKTISVGMLTNRMLSQLTKNNNHSI